MVATLHVRRPSGAIEGIDLRRIQSWMGHADIQTTMRYLHYVPAHDDAAGLTAAFASASAETPGPPHGISGAVSQTSD